MSLVKFQDTEIELIESRENEFLISTKDVAAGYGCTAVTIRNNQKNHKDELIEKKHWLKLDTQTKGGKQRVIHWTKKGIVRLGFFIKSEKAKAFRDWAEDYIIQGEESKPIKDNIDIQNINNRLKLLENIIANNLTDIAKDRNLDNKVIETIKTPDIIINSEKVKDLQNAQTVFITSKQNSGDNVEQKNKFYQDILKVIAKYPDGTSQRTLLSEAGYSQSNKIRRWLHEKISILWDMTIIPGKCYKYVLKDNK